MVAARLLFVIQWWLAAGAGSDDKDYKDDDDDDDNDDYDDNVFVGCWVCVSTDVKLSMTTLSAHWLLNTATGRYLYTH